MSYWGKYKAFVRKVDDPEQRGRIRVHCPAVMGTRDDETTWLDWALPCFSAKGFSLPNEGDGVWVEFEQGNSSYPIWTGCWLAGEDKSKSEAPSQAKDEYPDSRVFKTKAGHVVEISDKDDNKHIKITHSNGTSSIEIDKDGKIIVKTAATIHLGDKNPGDNLSLASLVKSEITALRNTVNSFVTTYNSHTHVVSGVVTAGGPTTQTQTAPVPTAAPGSSATPPAAVGDVKSNTVLSK